MLLQNIVYLINDKIMKEDLIKFETAKLAKEKGFDWSCLNGWDDTNEGCEPYLIDNEIISTAHLSIFFDNSDKLDFHLYSAPTQALLQKWLRETHNLIVIVNSCGSNVTCFYELYYNDGDNRVEQNEVGSYEDSLEKGLQEALKLI